VVVSAQGGGIQAEAWAARVLVGLQRRIPGFAQSLKLISGASGGAVGSMFFVQGLYCSNGSLDGHDEQTIVDASRASGLRAVGWGIVHPDLTRLILPLFPFGHRTDRGWALEESWAAQMEDKFKCNQDRATTLADWKKSVAKHELPAMIFNATFVDTGGPLLIGTVSPGDLDGASAVDVFATPGSVFKGLNLKMVTAARLASTFPYVTPVSRIDEKSDQRCNGRCAAHIADGGYFDNFGISSAVRWTRHLLEASCPPNHDKTQRCFTGHVTFIEILPFPEQKTPIDKGWSAEILGPPLTILRARGSTQSQGADLELDQLQKSSNTTLATVKFRFDCPSPTNRDATESVYQPPLSWLLSPSEQEHIDETWCKCAAGGKSGNAAIHEVATYLDLADQMREEAECNKYLSR